MSSIMRACVESGCADGEVRHSVNLVAPLFCCVAKVEEVDLIHFVSHALLEVARVVKVRDRLLPIVLIRREDSGRGVREKGSDHGLEQYEAGRAAFLIVTVNLQIYHHRSSSSTFGLIVLLPWK